MGRWETEAQREAGGWGKEKAGAPSKPASCLPVARATLVRNLSNKPVLSVFQKRKRGLTETPLFKMDLKATPKLPLCYFLDYVGFLLCFSKRPKELGQAPSVSLGEWLGLELGRRALSTVP